jgi:hypothetical protein
MTAWLVALAAGIIVGAAQYGWRSPRSVASALPAALLRSAAVALLVALLFDAPAGRARRRPPLVALDASASWSRGAGDLWRAATDSARAARTDTVLLFGDSLRLADEVPGTSQRPRDAASRVGGAVERAVAAGRSLVVVTDGELDDPATLTELPPGSRIVVPPRPAGRDAALANVEMPRAVVAGDTLEVQVTLASGAAGAAASVLTMQVGDRAIATSRADAMTAWTERIVALRGVVQAADGPTLVRITLQSAGDVEARNDTLIAVLDVSRAAAALFISTRPDVDAREALGVLRGTLAVPARGYWRVAPGQWRVDGTLAPIAESEVRRALREAPVVVLHGDTAALGSPRAVSVGALALLAPATEEEGEWYASGAPLSPLSAALSSMPWDSLAPVQAGPPPSGDWIGLEARLGRAGAPRSLIAGVEGPRRIAVVSVSGMWRWNLRGGASADAFTAVWGALFDWLLAGRRDPRVATPELVAAREGEPIRWRRGATSDSIVRLTLASTRAEAAMREDSVTLRFSGDDNVATSPPLPAGVYQVRMPAGRALLAVNPAREWVPRAPRVSGRTIRGTPVAERAPGLRRRGLAYAVVIVALCLEWILRRRRGLR